jgi:hypothetical protein
VKKYIENYVKKPNVWEKTKTFLDSVMDIGKGKFGEIIHTGREKLRNIFENIDAEFSLEEEIGMVKKTETFLSDVVRKRKKEIRAALLGVGLMFSPNAGVPDAPQQKFSSPEISDLPEEVQESEEEFSMDSSPQAGDEQKNSYTGPMHTFESLLHGKSPFTSKIIRETLQSWKHVLGRKEHFCQISWGQKDTDASIGLRNMIQAKYNLVLREMLVSGQDLQHDIVIEGETHKSFREQNKTRQETVRIVENFFHENQQNICDEIKEKDEVPVSKMVFFAGDSDHKNQNFISNELEEFIRDVGVSDDFKDRIVVMNPSRDFPHSVDAHLINFKKQLEDIVVEIQNMPSGSSVLLMLSMHGWEGSVSPTVKMNPGNEMDPYELKRILEKVPPDINLTVFVAVCGGGYIPVTLGSLGIPTFTTTGMNDEDIVLNADNSGKRIKSILVDYAQNVAWGGGWYESLNPQLYSEVAQKVQIDANGNGFSNEEADEICLQNMEDNEGTKEGLSCSNPLNDLFKSKNDVTYDRVFYENIREVYKDVHSESEQDKVMYPMFLEFKEGRGLQIEAAKARVVLSNMENMLTVDLVRDEEQEGFYGEVDLMEFNLSLLEKERNIEIIFQVKERGKEGWKVLNGKKFGGPNHKVSISEGLLPRPSPPQYNSFEPPQIHYIDDDDGDSIEVTIPPSEESQYFYLITSNEEGDSSFLSPYRTDKGNHDFEGLGGPAFTLHPSEKETYLYFPLDENVVRTCVGISTDYYYDLEKIVDASSSGKVRYTCEIVQ